MRWRTFALVVAGAFIGGAGGGWLVAAGKFPNGARPAMPRRTSDLPAAARPRPLEFDVAIPRRILEVNEAPWPISSPRVLP